MDFGILKQPLLDISKQINEREYCDQCHKERKEFAERDKKGTPYYSNFLLGFSSEKVCIPLNVLVVGEAHGGGRKENFRPRQLSLGDEVSKIYKYYMKTPDKTFHQREVRYLLNKIDKMKLQWVFTDLIKCFVSNKGENHARNKRIAILHCRKYLEDQLSVLQPKIVIGLGNTVAHYLRRNHIVTGTNTEFVFIPTLFPAQWTADKWIKNGAWKPTISRLSSHIIE